MGEYDLRNTVQIEIERECRKREEGEGALKGKMDVVKIVLILPEVWM